jgi:D-inositol-3-phosphate glycosyltransferase
MSDGLRRIAMVSMHTSPADAPGRGDAGGMNVAILALATQLARRGVEVDLLTRASRAPEEVELADGVILRTIAAGPLSAIPKNRLVDVADEFGEAVAILAQRTAPRYDLFYAHYWMSGLATLPVAIELGLPLVQSFHTLGAMKNRSLAPGDEPESEGRLRGEAYLGNQADAIVAASAAEITSLIDDLHAPADRLWVIPPGVDTELFTPERMGNAGALRERLGLDPQRRLIVVVGRVQPLKDQELAIRVLAELRALVPPSQLVIAGGASDASYLQHLRQLSESLGIAADVRFVGTLERETVADLFAAADLTLVTSHSETFGLVALESAASGTPVIAYRGTGLTESVREGESGYLVASRNPSDWARIIADHLSNAAAADAMRTSAREFAMGFTWALAAASHLALYESLIAAR